MSLLTEIFRVACLSACVQFVAVTAAFAEENPHGMDLAGVAEQSAVSGAGSSIDGVSAVVMIAVMFALLTISLTVAARISKSHFNRK